MFSQWFSGADRERYRTSLLKQRVDQVGSSLVQLRYASEVIRQHLHEWLRFSLHMEKNGIGPMPALGDDVVQQYLARRTKDLSASRSRVLRASIRILLEADQDGRFRRRIGSPPSTPAWFGPILTPYVQFVGTHRGLSARTERKYVQQLSIFAEYLEGAGIKELGRITPLHVREFYENAKNGVPRRSYGSTLRVFFRWAAAQGWLSHSLADAIPRPRQYRYVNLPDVLSQSDVDRILSSVDRSTPLGRRDYAILLLAARYGLRPCDIRQLTLDEIDWRGARIDIRQVKTDRPWHSHSCLTWQKHSAHTCTTGGQLQPTAPSSFATVHPSNRSLWRTTLRRSCGQRFGAQDLATELDVGAFTYFAIPWQHDCWLSGAP